MTERANNASWRVFAEAMRLAEASTLFPIGVYASPPGAVKIHCRGRMCSIYDLGGGRVRTSIVGDGHVRGTDWDDLSAAVAEVATWITEITS